MKTENIPASPDDGRPGLTPTLINATKLAEILGISQRTIWRLISKGQMIQPIRIGTSVRWRLDQVKSWIENGCPAPEE
jgi:excisionase family DNA binding protein